MRKYIRNNVKEKNLMGWYQEKKEMNGFGRVLAAT